MWGGGVGGNVYFSAREKDNRNSVVHRFSSWGISGFFVNPRRGGPDARGDSSPGAWA